MTLEFELWTHASRDPDLREHLTRRYRGAWRGIVQAAGRRLTWTPAATSAPP